MSALAEPVQRQLCARFSEGRCCPHSKNCPFIHKWALFRAARKEKRLAKLQYSHGDSGNKSCAQKHDDTSSDMPQEENVKPEDNRNGILVQIQDAKVAQKSSAAGKKTEQHVKDTQPSKPGKSRGKNRGKKILENIDHVQTANPMVKTPKTVKAFKPNKPLANMSSGHHASELKTKGQTLQSLPIHQKINQGISRNIGALSINTQWANSNWSKASTYGGHYANTASPRTAKETEDLCKSNTWARQMVPIRDDR